MPRALVAPRAWRGRRRSWRALVPALALVAACVTAQAVAVAHDFGPDEHPAGAACALCVSLGTLGAGDVAPGVAVAITAPARSIAWAGRTPDFSPPRGTRRARAPPAAS